jgi:hypothetical protein
MSGKMSIDDELNRLLAGEETELSALYRKLPAAEPDEKLDAAVLAMAHRAVNPHLAAALRQDRRRPQRPRPWMFALGSAAGLVLAAGVSWQLRSTIQSNGAESALSRNAPPAAERAITVKPMESDRQRVAATPAMATAPSPVTAPAPPPPAPAASAQPPQVAAKVAQDAKRDAEPEAVPELKKEQQEDFAQDEPAATADSSRREQQGVTQYTLPAGSAGPAPKPTPFPADSAKSSGDLEKIVVTGSRIQRTDIETSSPVVQIDKSRIQAPDSVERKAVLATGGNHALSETAAPQPGMAAAGAPAMAGRVAPATPATTRSTVLQNNSRLAPADWIGVMQQLLRDQRREEARENLALFRRKYPAYTLPADLKALLDHP